MPHHGESILSALEARLRTHKRVANLAWRLWIFVSSIALVSFILPARYPSYPASKTVDMSDGQKSKNEQNDFVLPVFLEFMDDKASHKAYSRLYSKYLRNYLDKSINLLEIGAGCVNQYSYGSKSDYTPGRSVKVWRSILPKASISLLDIDECALNIEKEGYIKKGSVFIGSQDDPMILQRIVEADGPFDVIIDDGSHNPVHQLQTFYHLFSNGLNKGGVYVIEDLETSINMEDPLVNGTAFRMIAEASILLTSLGETGRTFFKDQIPKIQNDFLLLTDVTSLIESVDWFEDAVAITKKLS